MSQQSWPFGPQSDAANVKETFERRYPSGALGRMAVASIAFVGVVLVALSGATATADEFAPYAFARQDPLEVGAIGSVRVVDIDLSGAPDLLAVDVLNNSVHWWRNPGDAESFEKLLVAQNATGVEFASAGDFRGKQDEPLGHEADGCPDVLSFTPSLDDASKAELHIWTQKGEGSNCQGVFDRVADTRRMPPTRYGPWQHVIAADIDATDGSDFVTTTDGSGGDSSATWWWQHPPAPGKAVVDYLTGGMLTGTDAAVVDAADLTGNGCPELIGASTTSVRWWRRTAGGGCRPLARTAEPDLARPGLQSARILDLSAADVSGDSIPDVLALFEHARSDTDATIESTVVVWLGSGTGRDYTLEETPHALLSTVADGGLANRSWTSFDVADLNADELVDVAVVEADTGLLWYRNLGLSSPTPTRTNTATEPVTETPTPTPSETMATPSVTPTHTSSPASRMQACETAPFLSPGVTSAGEILSENHDQFFRVRIDNPYTSLSVTVADTMCELVTYLSRECEKVDVAARSGLSSGSGTAIGSAASKCDGVTGQTLLTAPLPTGEYYLKVAAHPDARASFSSPIPFTILHKLIAEPTPSTPNPSDPTPATPFASPDPGVQTLIITDYARFASVNGLQLDGPTMVALRSKLTQFAGHDKVRGMIVGDLADDAGGAVGAAYGNWTSADTEDSVSEANALALELQKWIHSRRLVEYENVQYVVLVGDDRVVPHFRVSIHPPAWGPGSAWKTEGEYASESGAIAEDSITHQALLRDLVFTDDVYATSKDLKWTPSGGGIPHPPQTLFVPDMAVGRLVEDADDVTAALDAFLRVGEPSKAGVLDVSSAFLAGTDFMRDAAEEVASQLTDSGLPSTDIHTLLGPPEAGGAGAWTSAAQLQSGMLSARRDLVFVGAHSRHYDHAAPNVSTMHVDRISESTADLSGTLVLSVACHGGLNVPGSGHTEAVDFPEAWLAKGATLIGSSGWAYGMRCSGPCSDPLLGYQEDLVTAVTYRLKANGSTAVGRALQDAKLAYYRESALMDAMDAKTLMGTVLYGLPMYEVRLQAGGSGTVTSTDSRQTGSTECARVADNGGGVARIVTGRCIPIGNGQGCGKPVQYEIPPSDLVSETVGSETYYVLHVKADGMDAGTIPPWTKDGEPWQPRLTARLLGQDQDGAHLAPRGVVITKAQYENLGRFSPVVVSASRAGAPSQPNQTPTAPNPTPTPQPTMPPTAQTPQPTQLTATPTPMPQVTAEWFPPRLVELRAYHPDAALEDRRNVSSEAELHFYLGQYHDSRKQERLFRRFDVTEYYSDSEDMDGPVIRRALAATLVEDEPELVVIVDEADAYKVIALCDNGTGVMSERALTQSRDQWSGAIEFGDMCLVQAVDWSGNVSIYPRWLGVERPPGHFMVYLPYLVAP